MSFIWGNERLEKSGAGHKAEPGPKSRIEGRGWMPRLRGKSPELADKDKIEPSDITEVIDGRR